jgi:hypothetical protein
MKRLYGKTAVSCLGRLHTVFYDLNTFVNHKLNVSIFFIYFFTCFVYCIYHAGVPLILADINGIISLIGGDACSYVEEALLIFKGKTSFMQSRLLSLWPPGMLALSTFYLYVIPKFISIGLYYVALISLIYGFFAFKLCKRLKEYKAKGLLTIIIPMVFILMLNNGFSYFAYYSDPFSNMIFRALES